MEILARPPRLPLALLALVVSASAHAAPPSAIANVEQVKAAFLFNFLKFVDWAAPADPSQPWVIGVFGSTSFADTLDATVRGKTVNGRGILIKRLPSLAAASACNIAYIEGASAIPSFPGVLTVGENAILNFYLDDGQLRFEIHLDAAKSAGLHISSQLLKLARLR